jgi:hypothetical protein
MIRWWRRYVASYDKNAKKHKRLASEPGWNTRGDRWAVSRV